MTAPDGFRYVQPTTAERDAYTKSHASARYIVRPHVYRGQCVACGTRLWLSGLGIGSHRRACKGDAPMV